jgi:uncharacterized damage-inducible protein DinB
MFSREALQEAMRRTDAGTQWLLEHCRQLSAEELHRRLPGFGFPTVQLQLYHIMQAEEFWIDVLSRRPERPDRSGEVLTVEALEAHRRQTAAATQAYLAGLDDAALAESSLYDIDDVQEAFVPELVLLRLVTHPFHHRGQLAAMLRLLGYPVPQDKLDFPL